MIEVLNGGNDIWVNDPIELKEMAPQYYSDLYTSDRNTGGSFMLGGFPRIKDKVCVTLEDKFLEEEIHRALVEMQALKDPGPDGFQAVFFRKCGMWWVHQSFPLHNTS